MRKSLLITGTAFVLFFVACGDKENTPQPVKTRQQLIQQKWGLLTDIIREFDNTTSHTDTTTGATGNYADFNTDGHLYYYAGAGDIDTGAYQIINDDSIVVNGSGYTITTLSEGTFKLYRKENYSTPGTGKEEWVEFIRPIP